MKLTINYLSCCGVKEIAGLSLMKPGEEKKALLQIANHLLTYRATTLLFTQASVDSNRIAGPGGKDYGDRFRKFIQDTHLGTVTQVEGGKNPNSNNLITIYLWQVPHDRLKSWAEYDLMLEAAKDKKETIRKEEELYGTSGTPEDRQAPGEGQEPNLSSRNRVGGGLEQTP